MSFFAKLFQSKEHKTLQAALKQFDAADLRDLKPALDAVVAAYTDKGSESIESLPTTTKDQQNLLRIAKETRNAREELAKGSMANENSVLSSFQRVLSYRTYEAAEKTFLAANTLAREIAQADVDPHPKTLAQTKALDMLQKHYFDYSDNLGGAFDGRAGLSNYDAGMSVAFRAARGYKAFNHMADATRIYDLIVYKTDANAFTLKPEFDQEARGGATAKADLKRKPNFL